MTYSYYVYLEKYYDDMFDDYYEYYYWPKYYNQFNISDDAWCGYNGTLNATNSSSNAIQSTAFVTTPMNTIHLNNTLTVNCTPHYNGTYPPSLYEYSHFYAHVEIIAMIMNPLIVICTILSFAILILYFIQLSRVRNSRKAPGKIITVFTTTCIISSTLVNLSQLSYMFCRNIHWNLDTYSFSLVAWNVCWIVAKTSLYGVYGYRYYALRNASMQVIKKKNIIIFAMILITILCQFVLGVAYTVLEYMLDDIKDDDVWMSIDQWRADISWAIMFVDCVLVSSLGYLIGSHILKIVVVMAPIQDIVDEHVQNSRDLESIASHNVDPGSVQLSAASNAKKRPKIRRQKGSSKQMQLLEVATRVAVTCIIAMISSVLIQLMFLLYAWEQATHWSRHLIWVTEWWCVDTLINIMCIYLSMGFAKRHYEYICKDKCCFHGCFMWCLMRVVDSKTRSNVRKEIEERSLVRVPSSSSRIVSESGKDEDPSITSFSRIEPRYKDEEDVPQILVIAEGKIGKCSDCGEINTGKTYQANGAFYCTECWSCYYY